MPMPIYLKARQRFKVVAVTTSVSLPQSPVQHIRHSPGPAQPFLSPSPNTLLPDSCAAVQTEGRGSGQTRFCYVTPVYIREHHSGGQFCHTKGNCKLEE
ncbi:hypothetical protein ACRRTK_004916 [Alexandromys fortis]